MIDDVGGLVAQEAVADPGIPVLLVVLLLVFVILVALLVKTLVRRSRSGRSRRATPPVAKETTTGRHVGDARRSALTVAAEIAAIVGAVVAIVALLIR